MTENAVGRLVEKFVQERFLFVLVSLLSFLILSPLLKGFIGLSNLLNIFLTFILLSSIYAVSQKRLDFIISILLVLPLLLFTWVRYFIESPALSLMSTCLGMLFFGYMAITILSFIFKQTKVTLNIGCGSDIAVSQCCYSNKTVIIEIK